MYGAPVDIYIVDKKLNEFMRILDLSSPTKQFAWRVSIHDDKRLEMLDYTQNQIDELLQVENEHYAIALVTIGDKEYVKDPLIRRVVSINDS